MDAASTVPFAERPEHEQVAVLQAVAAEAACGFGLDVLAIAPVLLAYNATYRVDEPTASWALRVLVGSHSGDREIDAQQAWQLALAEEADLRVPVPRRAADGGWAVVVPSAAAGRDVTVTAATWLRGDDLDALDVVVAQELGATVARMHEHAASWRPPVGSRVPAYDGALFGDEPALLHHASLGAHDRDVLRRSLEMADAAQARAHASDAVRILHADLHVGNLKRSGASLEVLDFDDAAMGVPALDLAICAFYADLPELRAAIERGYRTVRALPDVDPADVEAMLAGRQLLLANDMLCSVTASLRAEGEAYLHRAVARLEAWQSTGRFSRSAA